MACRAYPSVQVALLYPRQCKSLLRTDRLDRLTHKIKQRMKCLPATGCSSLHVVTSYIKPNAPYAVGIPGQILNELSSLFRIKWVPHLRATKQLINTVRTIINVQWIKG